MRITIEHYVATNNPREVEELLKRKGIPSPKNLPDAISKLNMLMKREGNEIIKELSEIKTPYRELVLSSQDEKVSNACGCSGFGGNGNGEQLSNCSGSCDCNKKSNADASQPQTQTPPPPNQPTEEKQDNISKYAPLVAIGLLLVVTTAVLVKKV